MTNFSYLFFYTQGLISQEDSDGELRVHQYDRRGSTIALTNAAGEVTNTYEYDIYGEILSAEGETDNRFLYNGKYGVQTDDSDLYHMRARYYNPDLKRFINRDVIQGSILEPQTFNRYAYVNGNPISYIVPFGLSREQDGNLLTGVWNFFIGDDLNTLMNPHASGLQRAWAGISLASNFIPGAGPAFKGFKVLAKGLGKGISSAVRIGVSKVTNKFSSRSSNKLNVRINEPCPLDCFVAGTLIDTVKGKVPIEDIEVGDKVLAKDDITGHVTYKEVVGLFDRIAEETYKIYIQDEIIEVSGTHPFWVVGNGWVETWDLEIGDLLVTYDGQELPIDDIIVSEEPVKVYNFEVADYHTYFVSDLGIWTHNCATGGSGTKLGQNIFESMGVSKYTPRKGYQAHHLIPTRLKNHPVFKKVNFHLDDAENGIFLRNNSSGGVSATSRHTGKHPEYQDLVEEKLNQIDLSKSESEILSEISTIQSKLRKMLESGYPVYKSQGGNLDNLRKWYNKM